MAAIVNPFVETLPNGFFRIQTGPRKPELELPIFGVVNAGPQ